MMSNREYAHTLLDRIPESRLAYIVYYLEGAAVPDEAETPNAETQEAFEELDYDMNLLQQVINVLAVPAALQPQNKDHSLTGSYIPHRECHIQPDWLLIYYQTDTELYLYRTGTHADLFGL